MELLTDVTGENRGLDGGTISGGVVEVGARDGLLSVEEIGDDFDNTRDAGRTTDQEDLVDIGFVNLGVTENPLDGIQGASKQVLTQSLETGTSKEGVEVDTPEERVDRDGGGGGGGEDSLSTFAGNTETVEGTTVAGKVLFVLPLEFMNKVIDEPVVKILTA